MKTIIHIKMLLVLITLSAITSAFAPMGAHHFQISLDDKQLTQEYVTAKLVYPKVVIDPAENHKQLVVRYSECGRTVTDRVVTMKDVNDKVLKEWKFNGSAAGLKDAMMIDVKDIVALKSGATALKLFYSSVDFPQGQQIATVVIGSEKNTASR